MNDDEFKLVTSKKNRKKYMKNKPESTANELYNKIEECKHRLNTDPLFYWPKVNL